MSTRISPVLILFLVTVLALPMAAQRNSRVDRDKGPELGVARVSVADGDVRVRTAEGDETQARGGDPLRPGDLLVTGARSRAEVEFDRGNFARLAGDSELLIRDLGNLAYRVELRRGLAALSQFDHFGADLDVETPQATVRVIKPAVFTVELRGDEQTDVIVRDGQVDVVTDRRTERVKKGMVSVRGEGRDSQLRMAKAEPKSDFDDWSKRRDKMLDDGSSRGSRIYPPYWSAGMGWGWGNYAGWGWGYPYYPYYSFGPGLSTVVVSRPIGTLRGGGGHRDAADAAEHSQLRSRGRKPSATRSPERAESLRAPSASRAGALPCAPSPPRRRRS
ncbi:MAG: FecR domain-containing protein [Bryobacterales bacterium]